MTRHPLLNSTHPDDPHLIFRSGWLRAAVLGANDGIVSVSSLLVGVAAADPGPRAVLLAGVAGLTAGAMSMAAGEYVSVSSQADTEAADLAREARALARDPEGERAELAGLLADRGMSDETAAQAAHEMTEADALGAHAREELGLTESNAARPLLAAAVSGLTFSVSGSVPLLGAVLAPEGATIAWIVCVTLGALAVLGALGARAGGAPYGPAILRVALWGAAAMAVTALVGSAVGVAV